jgi:hypothetical protein
MVDKRNVAASGLLTDGDSVEPTSQGTERKLGHPTTKYKADRKHEYDQKRNDSKQLKNNSNGKRCQKVTGCHSFMSLGALKPATRGRVQNQQVNGRSVNVYSSGGYA